MGVAGAGPISRPRSGKGAFLDAVLAAVAAAAADADGFQGVPPNVPRSEGWIHSVREEPWRG